MAGIEGKRRDPGKEGALDRMERTYLEPGMSEASLWLWLATGGATALVRTGAGGKYWDCGGSKSCWTGISIREAPPSEEEDPLSICAARTSMPGSTASGGLYPPGKGALPSFKSPLGIGVPPKEPNPFILVPGSSESPGLTYCSGML